MQNKNLGPDLMSKVEFANNINSNNGNALFTSVADANFSLKQNSPAIDAGREIPGITDGYIGTAPDAGAYEYGKPVWSAGATMVIPEFIEEIPLAVKPMLKGPSYKIRLFPNPAKGKMVHIQNSFTGDTKLAIHNAKGRLVYQQTFSGSSLVLPVKQLLPSGIYMLTLQNESVVQTQKVVRKLVVQ
jgi:hypothetical protein